MVHRVTRMMAILTVFSITPTLFAGGDTEAVTPGWDAFPSLVSGTVDWSVAAGSTNFTVTYTLDGAAGANQEHMVGFHHFDVTGQIRFGGGTTSTGGFDPGSAITREGNSSVVLDTTLGFLATDGSGTATETFTVNGANPGVYGVQFHVREGGSPGCPSTSCNGIYRTGGLFADELVRFTIPGAAAFWSGDGDPEDEVGTNEATAVGAVAYRAGFFREGFDLDGSSYLTVANPVANGLASVTGFSVAARIVQDVFSNAASILNLRTAAGTSGFTLEPQFNSPGTIAFYVNTSGAGEYALVLAEGFPIGQPIFVVATFDAATHTMRLYRDGLLVAQKTDVPGTNMAVIGSEGFEIGRNIYNGAKFDGLIDELLYFDRALSPGEVLGIATSVLFADGFEALGTE